MNLNKHDIAKLLPHSGSMCLIDQVIDWDEQHICCSSRSHLEHSNPLIEDGELSTIHLLEYGAQVIAIHGGLLSQKTVPGFLAAIRNARIHCHKLQEIHQELTINATAIGLTSDGAIYEFQISSAMDMLIEARATIINT